MAFALSGFSFKRYKVDFAPDEPITHLVAGYNQVALATKDKKILLIDTKTCEQSICDIGRYYKDKLAQIKIYRLFLDPTGKFLLISIASAVDNQPWENLLYIKQLQSLKQLKSYLISSVAWNYTKSLPKQQSHSNGTLSTGTILLGTSKGLVLQTEFTHSDESKFFPLKTGPSQNVKEIFDVGPEAGPITGIEYYQVNNNNLMTDKVDQKSYAILLSTNNRLYRMIGNVPANLEPPPLQQIIDQNSTNYKDIPGRLKNSRLDLYYPPSPTSPTPTRFAWLTEPGVMTSELFDQLPACQSSFESNEDINIIPYNNHDEDSTVLSSSVPAGFSPQLGGFMNSYHDKPISMVVTNFHVIILMRHCIRAICILNNLTVYEEYFSMNYGDVQGMSKESIRNIIYVFFKRAVFKYKLSKENKDVWKIFLEQKKFDLAKRYSLGDTTNHDRVICEEAQHYFNLKDYIKSAEMFARSKKPSEDVALMFMDANCTKALKKYLMIRLDEFDSLSTQLTMTLSWLFEIIISSITILETEQHSEKIESELDELYSELDSLLECNQVIECLKQHPNLFYSIIQNYANWKIYISVAKLVGDHEHLTRALMYARDYDQALEIIRTVKRNDLFYTHGHLLMKHRSKDLVDALIEQPDIEPSKLIPILIQENPYYNKCCETIRYLEHCVHKLKTDCKVIHNTLFDLYARYKNEDLLMEYFESETNIESQLCHLDLQACLRVCTSLKLSRMCVVIYSHMGFYDEAVNLALEFDVGMAKSVTKRVDSEDYQKRLWLAIAKKVLTDKDANIQVAAELLNESKLLKIEDVLMFFPNYKTVDTIESALHLSLQSKRNEIISICDGTYEIIANEIRREIRAFKVRYSKLKCGQKCEICYRNIMSRSHYLFPCGHLFHYDCILKDMMSIDSQYQGIEEKLKQLTTETSQQQKLSSSYAKQQSFSANSFSSNNKANSIIDKEKIVSDLYEITSNECIYCGGFLANYLDKSETLVTDLSYNSEF